MSTQILSNSDFSIKSRNAISTDNGTLFIKTDKNNDYNVGIVSNNVFNLTRNKSIVFKFKADPYVEVTKLKTIWAKDDDTNIYVSNDLKLIVNNEENGDFTGSKFKVDGSNTNAVVYYEDKAKYFGDDSNNQVTDAPTDNVFCACAGDGFIGCITVNDDNKVVVNVYGKDNDDSVAVPDGVNNYDSSEDTPSKIFSGSNFVVTLKKNGKIIAWGNNKIVDEINKDLIYSDIVANDNSIGLLDINSNLHTFVYNADSDEVNYVKVNDVENFYIYNNNVVLTKLNGVVLYGELDKELDVLPDIKYPVEYIVDNNGKKILLGLNEDVLLNETNINPVTYKPEENNNEDYKRYPNLKRNDSFNMFFGIQNNSLPADIEYYTNNSGESTPIVVSSAGDNSMFSFIANNCKGFILTKYNNGADLLYNVKTKTKAGFLVDGFTVIPEEVIDYSDNIYKLVINFSPMGKSFRIFKEINGAEYEIASHFISIEEYPFELGRIAIYGKGVSNFELIDTSITDELDTSLLPEEILYRDLDMDVLQTKVAESMNIHYEAVKNMNSNLQKIGLLLEKMSKVYSERFGNIEQRLDNLEDN